MRFIEVNEGLRLRFPSQSQDFSEGFEMGAITALLSLDLQGFSRPIALANVDQAREIAESLGYRMSLGAPGKGEVVASFARPSAKPAQPSRPALRLVANS